MRCLIMIGAALVVWLNCAWALEEARVLPAEWPDESTYEFAIFDATMTNRIATAYYRVLSEESAGRPVYHIKYVGRNQVISEAAECWINPGDLTPLRSTRKVVAEGNTFYQDNAYANGAVVIRRKYEGGEVMEHQLPAPMPCYDYEELMWLVPQLDYSTSGQLLINVFVTIRSNMASIVVTDMGEQTVTIQGEAYTAHGYNFEVNMTPHALWTVDQNGQQVPARFDTGENIFVNLGLDPAAQGAPPAPAVNPPEAKPVVQPEPEPEPEPEAKPEEEEEEEPDPGTNPLGPPPEGGRF